MSKNIEKVGHSEFIAYPFHVDFKGDLSLGILGNHLLNCSNIHASQRGFGIEKLNVEHATWVLSRLSIEMNRYPQEAECFNIDTWISKVYRLFTDRCYAIESNNGEILGYGKSVWAMIDMKNRKPLDLEEAFADNTDAFVCDKECPIDKPGRIRVKNGELVHKHSVVYGDLDMNGHLNSIRYIEHALNTFSLDYHKVNFLRRFEIAYVAESYYNDVISIYKEEVSPGKFYLEVRKNDEIVVVRCKLEFENCSNTEK